MTTAAPRSLVQLDAATESVLAAIRAAGGRAPDAGGRLRAGRDHLPRDRRQGHRRRGNGLPVRVTEGVQYPVRFGTGGHQPFPAISAGIVPLAYAASIDGAIFSPSVWPSGSTTYGRNAVCASTSSLSIASQTALR